MSRTGSGVALLPLVSFPSGAFDITVQPIRLGDGSISLGPGQKITLGGIAKGYAVDRALEIMRAMGVRDALVDAGGDIRAMGRAEGRRDWLVALRNPRDPRDFITRIRCTDLAVLTSGDYERYYDPDRKFHHIVNPLTGYSATELISVTIVGPSAFDADLGRERRAVGTGDHLDLGGGKVLESPTGAGRPSREASRSGAACTA